MHVSMMVLVTKVYRTAEFQPIRDGYCTVPPLFVPSKAPKTPLFPSQNTHTNIEVQFALDEQPPPYSESHKSLLVPLVPSLPPQLLFYRPDTPLSMTTTAPAPPDASLLVTQVANPKTTVITREKQETSVQKEEDDFYCIYNLRGVRRDLKRRDAKFLPDPIAAHFKNGLHHIPWDLLTNLPWIPTSETVGDDWEYRAVPVYDLTATTFDWILDKVHHTQQLNQERPESDHLSMSFVREDLFYFVIPPRNTPSNELPHLKFQVGQWLLKRSDIHSALDVNEQWNHTQFFLSVAGFGRGAKWERRSANQNQVIIISVACTPLPKEGEDTTEAQKLIVFEQRAMRRTSWDYVWIPYEDLGLDSQGQKSPLGEQMSPTQSAKGKQPESASQQLIHISDGNPTEEKMEDVYMGETKDITTHWGENGTGVKVCLRRTITYQLTNVMDGRGFA